jgi:hypothetical protein
MGDSNTRGAAVGGPPAVTFRAEQLFDPRSAYGRMRASLLPDAKMRGFFHHLAVQQKAKRDERRPLAFAAKTGKVPTFNLVVSSADTQRRLDADVWLDLAAFGARSRLTLSFRIRDSQAVPPAGTACRALFLTPGMLERLCGAAATRSSDAASEALGRLLSGRSDADPFEAARVLAAVPELNGEVDEGGFCKFKPFDLPEQAGHVDELPAKTVLLVVVDHPPDGGA